MYPYLRMLGEIRRHRSAPRLGVGEPHVTRITVLPWDIDPWMELNNGRALTLFDLGRIVLFYRIGIVDLMKARKWVGTVAGSSVRYRRRLRAFDRVELRSAIIGWDARFIYAEQSMWRKDGECANHALIRMAITSMDGSTGIIPSAEVAKALGFAPESPPLPGWVAAWAEADAQRPWPPERGG